MIDPDRITLAAEWLIAGMRLSQVAGQAEKAGWSLTPAEVLDLIDQAHEQLAADAAIDPAKEDAKAVTRLNMLYTRSVAIQDYKTCLAVQKELNAVVARLNNPMLKRS